MRIGGGGRADKGGEFLLLFAKVEGVVARAPVEISGSERGRPFELEIAMEDGFHFKRLFGFYVEEDNGALRVHGDEKCFAHGESVAGIEKRGGFGAHGERASERFGREDTAFGEKVQMEFAEDL
ncbi:MAG: hypothetical protein DMG40_03475 [Acidobacteria bacterium]|nr:MAG: hypothetical protein DMG40_03475 [Acidobacteriota bacterium]